VAEERIRNRRRWRNYRSTWTWHRSYSLLSTSICHFNSFLSPFWQIASDSCWIKKN